MPHVAILVHRDDDFEGTGYFLAAFAALWRAQGIRVAVLRGAGEHLPADLAFLHVDLTVVPRPYRALAARYPRVVNGAVADISKRRVSAHICRRGDGWDGPVIVKTNRNYGGNKEAEKARRRGGWAGGLLAWRDRLPWYWRGRLDLGEYRVLERAADLPLACWLNPSLVVERFLPERDGEFYCLRTWVFLGDRETNSLSWSRHPVVKSQNVVRREPVADVPAELREARRRLGFDFGKFDYAVVDGRAVLYDANRTPALGSFTPEQLMPRVRHLAAGIDSLLAAPESARPVSTAGGILPITTHGPTAPDRRG